MSDDIKELKATLSEAKRLAIKRIEALSGDSDWNLLQQIVQEIESSFIISKNSYTNQKLLDLLKHEVESRYSDQPDLLEILKEGIPSVMTISKWRKKKGWEDAVWMRVRGEGLFTHDRRAKVINAMFEKANEGNVNAAKVWLTLSGDYVEKDPAAKNDALDLFRQMNEAIHSKK